MHTCKSFVGQCNNRITYSEITTLLRNAWIRKFGGNNREKQRKNCFYCLTFYNNFGSILVLRVRKNQIKKVENMSEFVKKSDILAEKIARRKEVTKEIKEMRSVGNYDGAEFLLNELRNLNRMIKNFSK